MGEQTQNRKKKLEKKCKRDGNVKTRTLTKSEAVRSPVTEKNSLPQQKKKSGVQNERRKYRQTGTNMPPCICDANQVSKVKLELSLRQWP